MVIDNYNKRRSRSMSAITDHNEPESSSEGAPDSPVWKDGSRAGVSTAPDYLSVKKSRRSMKKRVVPMKIGEVDGLRSKGETYPPSDSWAWRKYGQKPIKGSPYPRGYYRCSSCKGCPARKQVERNRLDPTTLIITYAYEHNHPVPTSKHHHHHHTNRPPAAATTDVTTPTTPSEDELSTPPPPSLSSSPDMQINNVINVNPFGDPPDELQFVGDSLVLENLGVEYNWVYDVSSFRTPFIVGPTCGDDDDDDEVVAFSTREDEEDESMFGNLGELPECSIASFSSNLHKHRKL